MNKRDWLAEGADPDDIDEPTDEEIEAEMAYRQYIDVAESAWNAADRRCLNGHEITFEDFMDNRCPECWTPDEIPF